MNYIVICACGHRISQREAQLTDIFYRSISNIEFSEYIRKKYRCAKCGFTGNAVLETATFPSLLIGRSAEETEWIAVKCRCGHSKKFKEDEFPDLFMKQSAKEIEEIARRFICTKCAERGFVMVRGSSGNTFIDNRLACNDSREITHESEIKDAALVRDLRHAIDFLKDSNNNCPECDAKLISATKDGYVIRKCPKCLEEF